MWGYAKHQLVERHIDGGKGELKKMLRDLGNTLQ